MPADDFPPATIPEGVSYNQQRVRGFQRYFRHHFNLLRQKCRIEGRDEIQGVMQEVQRMHRDLASPTTIVGMRQADKVFTFELIMQEESRVLKKLRA